MSKLIKYPSAERNKTPILEVLKQILFTDTKLKEKKSLKCLEIASGTGQHVCHFAAELPQVNFQPSDVTDELFDNIKRMRTEKSLLNVLDPVVLDLTSPPAQWPVAAQSVDIVYCCNCLHISPFATSTGLFKGSSRVLRPETGTLIVYGPMAVDGLITPQSNIDFDADLRRRDSSWGIRDTRLLNQLAQESGFRLERIFDMPANNKILHYKLE